MEKFCNNEKEREMKTFEYIIKDEQGIHARPAGILVKEAKKYESKIVIKKDSKSAEATKLMQLMSLGIKCGDKVTVEISGADEDIAAVQLGTFLRNTL